MKLGKTQDEVGKNNVDDIVHYIAKANEPSYLAVSCEIYANSRKQVNQK